MLCLLAEVALAASTPEFPQMTPEEWARLEGGEVVLRARADGGRVTALGVVKVDATPEALWSAILDVHARISEGRTLESVREYRRDGPRTWYLEVGMEVLGADVTVHHRYTWDPVRQQACYTLDPDRPNDLAVADGWYLVRPSGDSALLAFESVTEAKVPVPGWVKRWLARDEVESLLGGIRTRAEREPRRRG